MLLLLLCHNCSNAAFYRKAYILHFILESRCLRSIDLLFITIILPVWAQHKDRWLLSHNLLQPCVSLSEIVLRRNLYTASIPRRQTEMQLFYLTCLQRKCVLDFLYTIKAIRFPCLWARVGLPTWRGFLQRLNAHTKAPKCCNHESKCHYNFMA